MYQFFISAILAALFAAPTNSSVAVNTATDPGNKKAQKVTVYTTANNSNYRLTASATLSFSAYPQPFETEPAIFVDPSKKFQTFVGIGGALTDASAETFAKMSKAKQQEIIEKYFDAKKGIG